MAFRAMAEIKVNPDGTITGYLLQYPEVDGVGLVDNGVYALGYDDWAGKVAIEFKGKADADQS